MGVIYHGRLFRVCTKKVSDMRETTLRPSLGCCTASTSRASVDGFLPNTCSWALTRSGGSARLSVKFPKYVRIRSCALRLHILSCMLDVFPAQQITGQALLERPPEGQKSNLQYSVQVRTHTLSEKTVAGVVWGPCVGVHCTARRIVSASSS